MSTASAPRQDWRNAYDTQLEQIRWTRSDTGRAWLASEARRVAAEYSPATRILIEAMYEMEGARLEAAVPYFVSPNMCEVVDFAHRTFEPEPIYPTDVLSMSGFVYFAKPLLIGD